MKFNHHFTDIEQSAVWPRAACSRLIMIAIINYSPQQVLAQDDLVLTITMTNTNTHTSIKTIDNIVTVVNFIINQSGVSK